MLEAFGRQVAALVVASAIVAAAAPPVSAQEKLPLPAGRAVPANPAPTGLEPPTPGDAVEPSKGPVGEVVKGLRRGPLLIHGNYCGIGNRPGQPPIDALDAACMRHDACTVTGKLPSCACDDRLGVEAAAIANDPRTPPDVKAIAAATATSMALLVCKIAPHE